VKRAPSFFTASYFFFVFFAGFFTVANVVSPPFYFFSFATFPPTMGGKPYKTNSTYYDAAGMSPGPSAADDTNEKVFGATFLNRLSRESEIATEVTGVLPRIRTPPSIRTR
jgi:hypothetical protein